MKLRKLKLKDAPLMLEWMHDDSVVHDLRTDFLSKSINDCNDFIVSAQDMTENIHLAIVDDKDNYMGTVSLKHISDGVAEFGITVRKCAMGKGYASYGMHEIIKMGFEESGISMVYWCVDLENHRAVRFYDKNGFAKCDPPKQAQYYSSEEKEKYIWYCVCK